MLGQSLSGVAVCVNFVGQQKEKASVAAHGSSTTGPSRKNNKICSPWKSKMPGRLSGDGGATWVILYSPTAVMFTTVCFLDGSTGYIGTEEGKILRTNNGGLTWVSWQSSSLLPLFSIRFTDASTGYAVGGVMMTRGFMLKTVDGGGDWKILDTQVKGTISSVWFTDSNTGYIVGEDGAILKTTNGGTGFTDLYRQQSRLLVSPNPASDMITIEQIPAEIPKGANLSIFDMKGRLILKKPATGKTTTVNIQSLASGVYLAEIGNSSGKARARFVKK